MVSTLLLVGLFELQLKVRVPPEEFVLVRMCGGPGYITVPVPLRPVAVSSTTMAVDTKFALRYFVPEQS